jgi:retron-type reverse transcriptase
LTNTISYDLVGVPQGQIVSPILWNIYFQEFDNYIANTLKPQLERWNLEEKRTTTTRARARAWNNAAKRLENKRSKSKKLHTAITTPYHEISDKDFQAILKNRRGIRADRKTLFSLPSKNYAKNKLRIHYVRYADDWVIFTN